MKRLSVNRIAVAGLRADKRGYRSMAMGIFLSIFFIATLCQCAWGAYAAAVQNVRARMGQADCFLFDTDDCSDSTIMEEGSFDQLGHITLSAQAGSLYIGSYDETAASIMDRHYLSGRAPENPGEMAAEQSFLDHMNITANVGDTFELTVTPIDGVTEKRTYTLTGILEEQTARFEWRYISYVSAEHLCALPSALIYAEDTPFDSGRIVTQRVMTLKRGVSLDNVLSKNYAGDGRSSASGVIFVGLTDMGTLTDVAGTLLTGMGFTDDDVETLYAIMGFLGGSLLLACCVGIAGAMEGQLARRTQEIAMLRAVGATRRQIRHIFGREAWLLALIMAPVSIALSCLAVWGLSCALPGMIVFEIKPAILVPIVLLSIVCIVVSAAMPLRRASCVLPMGVLRDTALLRRMGRVKKHNVYKPAQLVAWRQNRLHPLRPLGAGLLTGLMLVCMLSALMMFGQTASLLIKPSVSFSASFYMDYASTNDYYTMVPERALSESDIAQIKSLSGVEKTQARATGNVCWITDSLPQYLKDANARLYLYGLSEDEALTLYDEGNDELTLYDTEEAVLTARSEAIALQNRVRSETGIAEDKTLAPLGLLVVDEDVLSGYASTLTDGSIDIDAINRGEQVVLSVPDRYVMSITNNGVLIGTQVSNRPFEGAVLTASNNGDFTAGQTLDLMLLTGSETDWDSQDEEGFYAGLDKQETTVTVGAVCNGTVQTYMSDAVVTVITTRSGLNAMGLTLDYVEQINVYTEDNLTTDEEETLSEAVERIVRRADNMSFSDQLALMRSNRRQNSLLTVTLVSVALLLFAVAVGMITGGVTRRIRADARMIGTLRAVGADARTVAGCYRIQIYLSMALGLIIGLIYMAVELTGYTASQMPWIYGFAPVCVVGFTLLCCAACMLVLRSRIRETVSRSIVENIREM